MSVRSEELQPTDHKLQMWRIEKANSPRREQLIAECGEILQREHLTGSEFNRFISRMVQLIGGVEEATDRDGSIQRSDMLLHDSQYQFEFVRVREYPWDFGAISVYPLTDVGKRHFYVETINYGYNTDLLNIRTRTPQPSIFMQTRPLEVVSSVFFGLRYQLDDPGEMARSYIRHPISIAEARDLSLTVFDLYLRRPHILSRPYL